MKASLTLRLPEELRMKIKEEASRSDMSINQYVLYTLTKEISYKDAERELKERIRRAPSREAALRLLDAVVPDVAPLPNDELPSNIEVNVGRWRGYSRVE
ncbi:MAG: toxin-antitoxin system HicB family antitoxin [Deltaproteobacteria bacterium]|nr:toxin-antitoxin system HicB family antitoxin [Deltaproteobacteria bacterium]